jgi:arylsulfatase A-like enzyme
LTKSEECGKGESGRRHRLGAGLGGGIAGGAAAGLLLGFGECLIILVSVGPFWATPLFLLRAEAIYAVAGGAGGFAATLLLALRRRSASATRGPSWAAPFALVFSFGLAAEALFLARDLHAFETAEGRWSGSALAFLFGTLLVSVATGVRLRKIARSLGGGPVRRRRIAAIAVAASCLALFFGLRAASTPPAGPSSAAVGSSAGPPPNIIILLLDSLRADHLSAYGYPLPTSPRIDRLAKEGILFRRCIAASSWTVPTHATLFSGMLPSAHGDYSLSGRWDPSVPTLAQILTAAGYRTASFYDNKLVGRAFELDRGFQTSVGVDSERKASLALDRIWHLLRGRHSMSATIMRVADRWIGHGTAGAAPYFVFMNMLDTHAPYRPRRPYAEAFLRALPPDPVQHALVGAVSGTGFLNKRRAEAILRRLTPADWRWISRIYDSNIRAFDEDVAALLERLEKRGDLENTIILVTADHGEILGEGDSAGHYDASLLDAGLHIPLILWEPGRLAPADIATPVSQADVFPTLLSLAGVPLPRPLPIQGESLLAPRENRPIVAEFWDEMKERFSRVMYLGEYKLTVFADGKRRLIDLARDPGETNDLAPSRPDLADALQARLNELVEALPRGRARIDEKERQRRLKLMRSLGYISN